MASLATQETKVDLGNNDIVIDIDYKDIDTYASKKAASFGTKGNFQGEDEKGEKIEPSGTGKNEGKFTLKDVRKCPNVQKWINRTKADGEKKAKVVSKFSSKTAEKLFSEKFPGMKAEDWKGKRSGKGKSYWPNKNLEYDGEWLEGKYHGCGVSFLGSGK